MKPTVVAAEELCPVIRQSYVRRLASVMPGATRVVQVFWWPEAPLTYVWFADGDGELQVASVGWRHDVLA